MKIKIDVTKKDISNGIVGDGTFCPISQAFNRVFNKVDFINIDGETAEITLYGNNDPEFGVEEDDQEFSLKLPSKAGEFVYKFDNHETVTPFSFNVSLTKKDAAVLKPAKRFVVAA